jgi:flagellar basal body-associated protein FliL
MRYLKRRNPNQFKSKRGSKIMVYLTIILIATIMLPIIAIYMVMIDVMAVTAAQHREESRFQAHAHEEE